MDVAPRVHLHVDRLVVERMPPGGLAALRADIARELAGALRDGPAAPSGPAGRAPPPPSPAAAIARGVAEAMR